MQALAPPSLAVTRGHVLCSLACWRPYLWSHEARRAELEHLRPVGHVRLDHGEAHVDDLQCTRTERTSVVGGYIITFVHPLVYTSSRLGSHPP
jgi:hypothetical protein